MHLTPDWMRVRHIYLHTAVWKPFWVHLRMCICVSERDPPGFRSKQFSVNLIDRETPSPSPSSVFFTIYHPFSHFSTLPPEYVPPFLSQVLTSSCPLHVQSSRCFSVSCLSSPPPSFLLLFIILPPSCFTLDDINTSFCLRRDRITCGNTAYNHSSSAIRKCACVCGNSSMQACVKMCPEWSKLMKSEAQRLSSHWWKCCSRPWIFSLELLQSHIKLY